MIKEKIIEYRNTHRESRTLLGVVLGEIALLEKSAKRPVGEATDAECTVIIKKMIANNIECNEFEENKILELFMPQQLTESDIRKLVEAGKFPSIKECMTYFRECHAGQYDGKVLSSIYQTYGK